MRDRDVLLSKSAMSICSCCMSCSQLHGSCCSQLAQLNNRSSLIVHFARKCRACCVHTVATARAQIPFCNFAYCFFFIASLYIYVFLLLFICSKLARPKVILFPQGDVYSAFKARVCLAVVHAERVRSKLLLVYSLLEIAPRAYCRQRSKKNM